MSSEQCHYCQAFMHAYTSSALPALPDNYKQERAAFSIRYKQYFDFKDANLLYSNF